MNPQDPLAQLRDIHLPPDISWWPLAIGWWVLAVLLLIIGITTVRWFLKHRASNRYRREALQQLVTLAATQTEDKQTYCSQILTLLRRTVKTAYPQLSLASVPNGEMLEKLNQCCKATVFDASIQRTFHNLAYQKHPEIPS